MQLLTDAQEISYNYEQIHLIQPHICIFVKRMTILIFYKHNSGNKEFLTQFNQYCVDTPQMAKKEGAMNCIKKHINNSMHLNAMQRPS